MVDTRPLRFQAGDLLNVQSPNGEATYFEVLGDELDAGASGVVYECIRDDGVLAVLKGPKLIGAKDPAVTREAALLSKIPPHPNLVAYMGVYRDPRGHTLLFMERGFDNPVRRLSKDHVRKRLQGKGDLGGRYASLPPVTALEMAYELALAVGHLHANRLAHCDIKPDNIMIRMDWADLEYPDRDYFEAVAKGRWRTILLDLGGARSFRELNKANVGREGTLLPAMTPMYTPPEVLPGREGDQGERSEFTAWADIYAFGLTVYELLTGHGPFGHMESVPRNIRQLSDLKRKELYGQVSPIQEEIFRQIDWGDSRLEVSNRDEMTTALWRFVSSCVAPDHRKRPTAQRALSELRRLLRVEQKRDLELPIRTIERDWVQRAMTLDKFSNRFSLAGRDGSVEGKADLKKIRRGGADFWEMQGLS